MNSTYKIINKELVYDGFFKLHKISFNHKKHNNKWSPIVKREVFSGSHVSTVLPYDPIKKKILLLSQFRAGLIKRGDNPMMIEIVAGMIDEGETPEEAAKRECYEETGCITNRLSKINSYYPAPGSSESFYHLFLAEVDSFEGEKIFGQENENEDILVKSYSIAEVKKMLENNLITNAVTIIALQWFFLKICKD